MQVQVHRLLRALVRHVAPQRTMLVDGQLACADAGTGPRPPAGTRPARCAPHTMLVDGQRAGAVAARYRSTASCGHSSGTLRPTCWVTRRQAESRLASISLGSQAWQELGSCHALH